jgi:hypothetical protein
MTPQEIPNVLASLFGDAVRTLAPGSYQIEQEGFRLLVLRSEDQDWIRMMVPIVSLMEAGAFLEEFLEANFDETLEGRYAVHQGMVWTVFHHDCGTLTESDFQGAIGRLVSMFRQGVDLVFKRHVEKQIRQIIRAAKMQGQSLEMTMQTLERFYSEGVMGDLDKSSEGAVEAWRVQLKRLWDEEG